MSWENLSTSEFPEVPRRTEPGGFELSDFFLLLVFILFFLVLAATDLRAATVPQVSGRLFTDLYIPHQEADKSPYNEVATSLWLDVSSKLNDQSQMLVTIESQQLERSPNGTSANSQTQIREGFLLYNSKGYEFRIGRQIVPWGKSDAINPTDFLTAKNMTFLNPDEEVRRTGTTLVLVNWTPSQGTSNWTLTGVFIPVFAESQILINPATIPSGVTVGSLARRPQAGLSASESALKISYLGEGWDFSVLYFNGWNHLPEYEVTNFTTPAVAPVFHRQHAVGGDFSFTSGDWIYRGEVAQISTENPDGTNPMVQPSHLDAVVGVEKSFWDHYRIQIQGLVRHSDKYTAPQDLIDPSPLNQTLLRQVAGVNALILNYQDKTRTAATLRLAYSHEESRLDAEVFVLGNFVGQDYVVKPKVTYGWTDALKTTLGMDSYNGPSDRPLGAMKPYNSFFMEAKYSF